MLHRYEIFLCSAVLLLLIAASAPAQVIGNASEEVQLTARDMKSILVPPGVAAKTIAFSRDTQSAAGGFFSIGSSTQEAIITLVQPNGTEITSGNAEAYGYKFVIAPEDPTRPTVAPGTYTLIGLPSDAPAGIYNVKVNTTPVASADSLVTATYLSSSPIRAGVIADAVVYRLGDTIVLSALVFDGSVPVTGATIVASVGDPSQPNAAPSEVALIDAGERDDATGDGIYTGTFAADRLGQVPVTIQVTGTSASGLSFSRVATTTVRVVQPLARFSSFSDGAADDNFNGLMDRIMLTANVDVQKAGKYQFGATLRASNGETVKASSFTDLLAGSQQATVSFGAEELIKLGVDGPYEIKDAVLTFQDEEDVPIADYRENAGNTAAYRLSSLERPALFFTGRNTATGIDYNGNGKFDALNIAVEVEVATEDYYQWGGNLVDRFGKEIDFASGGAYLSNGNNTLTFTYNGSKIGQNGKNGPYSLRSVFLYGSGENSLIVDKVFDTQAFRVTEFENAVEEIETTTGDTVAPTVTATRLTPPNAAGWNNSDVTITLSAADNQGGSGVRGITYSTTGAQTTPVTTISGTSGSLIISTEGTTTVTYAATDNAGNVSTPQSVIIKLDKTAPAINSAKVDQPVLSPPNHKMVDVRVDYNLADALDAAPLSSLNITSNEPVNGTGDGDTAPDWEVIDAHHIRLRAERSGNGNGRVYTIKITSTDRVGNASSRIVTVTVTKG